MLDESLLWRGAGDKITAWEDMENGVGASSTLNIGEQVWPCCFPP